MDMAAAAIPLFSYCLFRVLFGNSVANFLEIEVTSSPFLQNVIHVTCWKFHYLGLKIRKIGRLLELETLFDSDSKALGDAVWVFFRISFAYNTH